MADVQVSHQVNTLTLPLAGKSVGEVRTLLAQALNIDPSAQPMINGEECGPEAVLAAGDELEFVKSAGTKGC